MRTVDEIIEEAGELSPAERQKLAERLVHKPEPKPEPEPEPVPAPDPGESHRVLAGVAPTSEWHRPGISGAGDDPLPRRSHRRHPTPPLAFEARCAKCGRPMHRSRSHAAGEAFLKALLPLKTYRCRACNWRGWRWIGWAHKLGAPRPLTRLSLVLLVVVLVGGAVAAYVATRSSGGGGADEEEAVQ